MPVELSPQGKRIYSDVMDVATWLHRRVGGQVLVGVSYDPAKWLHISSVWVVQRGEGEEIGPASASAAFRAIGYIVGAPRAGRPGMIEGIDRRGSAHDRLRAVGRIESALADEMRRILSEGRRTRRPLKD